MKNLITKYHTKLKAAGASTTATLILSTANAYAAEDYLKQGMTLMSKALLIGGGIWTVWGIVVVAMSLNDHNGSQMKDGFFKAIGGAMVVAATAWFTSMDTSM